MSCAGSLGSGEKRDGPFFLFLFLFLLFLNPQMQSQYPGECVRFLNDSQPNVNDYIASHNKLVPTRNACDAESLLLLYVWVRCAHLDCTGRTR